MSEVQKTYREEQINPDSDAFIEDSAEAAYLSYDGEEVEANDNFPAHEILQGCIWRDTESSQSLTGLGEESPMAERDDELSRRGELDFSEDRRGGRGFLDEDAALSFPDFPEQDGIRR
ncbi:MAG: hypothetical protein WDZ54_01770 [Sneathiella sp.]